MLTLLLLAIFLLIVSVILILMWQYNRRRNSIENQDAIKRETNQVLLESTLEIREQTIRDIRQELHNNMGQLASLIKINLHSLPIQEQDLASVKIEETKENTQQLINDIKSLTLSLSDEYLTLEDFGKTLEFDVDRLNKSGRVHITISQEENFQVPDQLRSVILYRLSQEIIHHRIKQGKAKHLSILLQRLENLLILSFKDDGGIADEEGLLSALDKKTKLINARLLMRNTPLEKNAIRIEMPL